MCKRWFWWAASAAAGACGASLSTLIIAIALTLPAAPAQAACSPAAPVNNTTVTCSGTTTDQNAPDGYGSGTDTGLTINVLSGATVTSTTDNGLNLNGAGASNTVNNFGTITGLNNGILAFNGTLVLNNYGSISGTDPGFAGGVSANDLILMNFGSITGGADAVFGNNTAYVVNYGTITGSDNGIKAFDAFIINYGTISATAGFGVGVDITNSGTLINYGSITATGANTKGVTILNEGTVYNYGSIRGVGANAVGMFVDTNANVYNSGSIFGTLTGIAGKNVNLTNTGTIVGNTGIASNAGGTAWTVVNSGIIQGTGGTAINLTNTTDDSLTFLAGSRIIGAITLGVGDGLHFNGGNNNLTFTSLTGRTTDGTTPFVRSGNRVASIDPTSFAVADRTMTDVTRAISGVIDSRAGEAPANPQTGATAFASAGIADRANDAFAGIPSLAYARDDTVMFRNPNATAQDGTGVWAKGFAGQRTQQAEGTTLRTMTSFFGGVFGIDKAFRHDLRLGVFLGAGRTRQSTEVDVGSIDSDLAFGGVYGRHTFGASFLDVSLLGGYSRNASTRNINNNMIPGGLEYAKAAFDGWFISPEIAYGYRYAFNNEWSLTPAARLRYLATMLGGYTETGSTANLTVNARTLQNIEERGDLTLTRTITHSQTERIQTSATLACSACSARAAAT